MEVVGGVVAARWLVVNTVDATHATAEAPEATGVNPGAAGGGRIQEE